MQTLMLNLFESIMRICYIYNDMVRTISFAINSFLSFINNHIEFTFHATITHFYDHSMHSNAHIYNYKKKRKKILNYVSIEKGAPLYFNVICIVFLSPFSI